MSRFQILPEARPNDAAELMPCAACDVRELSICSSLRGKELDRIAPLVTRSPVAPGQVLFQEGDEAGAVYNIITGAVRLFKLLPDGRRLHLLTWHATPPAFEGPDRRNSRRNHDEAARVKRARCTRTRRCRA